QLALPSPTDKRSIARCALRPCSGLRAPKRAKVPFAPGVITTKLPSAGDEAEVAAAEVGNRGETLIVIVVVVGIVAVRLVNPERKRGLAPRVDDDAVMRRKWSEHTHSLFQCHRRTVERPRLDADRTGLRTRSGRRQDNCCGH